MKVSQHKQRVFSVACSFFSTILLFAAAHGTAAQSNTFPASGNAGVGTTTPADKLEVSGSGNLGIRISSGGGSTDYSAIRYFNGGSEKGVIFSNQENFFIRRSGSGSLILNDNGGNVGIGTTSPDQRLTMANGSTIKIMDPSEPNWGTVVSNDAQGNGFFASAGHNLTIEAGWDKTLTLGDAQYNNYGGKVIIPGGNVGIGTANPANLLHINSGTSPSSQLRLSANSAGSLSGLAYSADNIALGFDVDWNNGWIARHGTVASLYKINSKLQTMGWAGATVGSPIPSWTIHTTLDLTTGNFGIGTANPMWGRLQVNKIIRIDDDSGSPSGSDTLNSAPNLYIGTTSGGNVFQFNANGGLDLWQHNNAAWSRTIVFAKNGNVGIGALSPGYKLDVAGQVRSSTGGFVFPDGTVQTTAAAGGGTGTSQWNNISGGINYSAGNVGVGSGSVASGPLPGINVAVGGNSYVTASDGVRTAFLGADSSGYGMVGTLSNNDFVIRSNNAERIRVTAAGNVGIGTTTPSERLHVYNNAGHTYILADALNANHSVFSLRSAGSETGAFYRPAGTNDVRIWSGADRVTVLNNSGNVGIGTTTPAEKLEINGNVKVSGTGNITAAGTIEAGNIKAKYQDVAEWVPASEQLSAGTVVVLDSSKSNQVISSSQAYDTRVAGVISEQPGIALGESGPNKVLVATTGRVRVKVDATHTPIQVGDLLVTSDVPGVAMRSEPVNLGGVQFHRPGTIIGKALESLAKGSGEILVLLSLQ